jgi:hypothetical protein
MTRCIGSESHIGPTVFLVRQLDHSHVPTCLRRGLRDPPSVAPDIFPSSCLLGEGEVSAIADSIAAARMECLWRAADQRFSVG